MNIPRSLARLAAISFALTGCAVDQEDLGEDLVGQISAAAYTTDASTDGSTTTTTTDASTTTSCNYWEWWTCRCDGITFNVVDGTNAAICPFTEVGSPATPTGDSLFRGQGYVSLGACHIATGGPVPTQNCGGQNVGSCQTAGSTIFEYRMDSSCRIVAEAGRHAVCPGQCAYVQTRPGYSYKVQTGLPTGHTCPAPAPADAGISLDFE